MFGAEKSSGRQTHGLSEAGTERNFAQRKTTTSNPKGHDENSKRIMPKNRIKKQRWLRRIGRWVTLIRYTSKKIRLPGFKGESLYDISRFFFKGLAQPMFVLSAQAMAFNFFLSVFPALIFAFQLIPYVPIAGLEERTLELLATVLPPQGFELISKTVEDLFDGTGWGAISLTVISTLFTASRGIVTMMNVFDALDFRPLIPQGLIKKNLKALAILFVFVLIMLLGVAVIVTGELILARIARTIALSEIRNFHIDYYLVGLGRWALEWALLYAAMSFLYKAAPAQKNLWRFSSPGAFAASLLLLLAQIVLTHYFVNFANYNQIYGTLGAVIALMLWFYYISWVIIFGYYLDVNIVRAKIEH
jgi:membrane protein